MPVTVTGTLVFIVSGFHEAGTAAGAWYFANAVVSSLADFDRSWYVYEWADDASDGPSSADEFMLLERAD